MASDVVRPLTLVDAAVSLERNAARAADAGRAVGVESAVLENFSVDDHGMLLGVAPRRQ